MTPCCNKQRTRFSSMESQSGTYNAKHIGFHRGWGWGGGVVDLAEMNTPERGPWVDCGLTSHSAIFQL